MLFPAVIGFIIGFFGSVPIAGPIAALVLHRGLERRDQSGMYIAWSAAAAEGIYAYLAFWGFEELLGGYPWVETASRLAGSLLLTALGVVFVLRPPRGESALARTDAPVGVKRNLLLGFSITALNPTLLATWGAAVTMAYSLAPAQIATGGALSFALGAVGGVGVWFTILLVLLRRFSDHVQPDTVARVVRLTGFFLLMLGSSALLRFGYLMATGHAS